MATVVRHRSNGVEGMGREWTPLLRSGGLAAALTALLIPVQVAVFLLWPPPTSVPGWFQLLRERRLVGLVDLDLLLVVDNLLLVVVLLALYVSLRPVSQAWMALLTVFGVLGAVLFVVTNPAFEMLRLSDAYAVAGGERERLALEAAGAAVLAVWQGTAFHVAYLVGSLVGIGIGVAMLRSPAFGRAAGYAAILGNAIGLGLYVPEVGIFISVFSVLFLEAWYVLLARRLLLLPDGPRSPSLASAS